MRYRTILMTADTGGLSREAVREAVISVRNRRVRAPLPRGYRLPGGALLARETPLFPYGTARSGESDDDVG